MPVSPFWTPQHGQWVLCGVGLPFSHLSAKGEAVGIFQVAERLVNPADRTPQLDANGQEMWNPPYIVPVNKDGSNVVVDRTNYKDLKGYSVLIPGKGICHIGVGAEGETIDKFFADNRMAELKLVLSVSEAKLVGLANEGDLPPGRERDPNWKR